MFSATVFKDDYLLIQNKKRFLIFFFNLKKSVLANDENGKTVSCSFPFKYKGNTYKSCINLDQPDYWCSLTPDFDKDNKKGVCHLGLLIFLITMNK